MSVNELKIPSVKVLLDNGISSHAEFAVSATKTSELKWGPHVIENAEPGYIRKPANKDKSRQEELDALFTIGRLIKEKRITAFTYIELGFESWQRTGRPTKFNALNGCDIEGCPSPIERSKFRKTINFEEHISKGGKKDKKKGIEDRGFSQISFFRWLVESNEKGRNAILETAINIGLTEFEIESFKCLDWFQFVCRQFGSTENYSDAFHLWAAERNEIEVFLTLDKKLVNIVNQIRGISNSEFEVKTRVLQPIELLRLMDIDKLDEVPMEFDKFYPLYQNFRE